MRNDILIHVLYVELNLQNQFYSDIYQRAKEFPEVRTEVCDCLRPELCDLEKFSPKTRFPSCL